MPWRERGRLSKPKMIDSKSTGSEAGSPAARRLWMQRAILGTVCALVIGVYAYTAHSGYVVSWSLNADDEYYNLLAQGFRAGQLNLKKEAPPALAQLADPYDPAAHAGYGMLDMSYYRGKLYLYFGVTPAVLVFWPYVALTGHYVLQKDAAVIFCLVGFLAGAGLLWALWRRYFARVNVAVVVAGALALGLVTYAPSLLAQCDVWEVPISCGYAMTMLALTAIWKALHETERRCWWLAAASLAYGLAVGARPGLLFGMVILLAPVGQAWRERRSVLAPFLSAVVPIGLIGLGLMMYNALRFDNPFEVGWRYQLTAIRQETGHFFDPRYLWFNFRIYFLEPARWSGQFPFVRDISLPALPAGHLGGLGHPFGVLTNIPLMWLALAVPLGWRWRPAQERAVLCGFLAAATALFGVVALTIGLLAFAQDRYEMEFLPALALLAVIGILSVERALAPTPASESGQVDRPVWRRGVRWGWGLLLAFSVAFNLLVSVGRCAEAHDYLGRVLLEVANVPDAIVQVSRALRLKPDFPEAHNDLGIAFTAQGRVRDAIEQFERALQIQPDYTDAHYNLAVALLAAGRIQEAIRHYEQALRLKPDFAEAHNDLGVALEKSGRAQEAIQHYLQALRIKPDYAEAQSNLARTRAAH